MLARTPLLGTHLFFLVAFALGCADSAEPIEAAPPPATAPDLGAAPDADAGSSPDLGIEIDAGTTPDAGVPDLGPPARRLVSYRPLGDTPIDNLVMNPLLDTTSALRPAVLRNAGLVRIVTTDSPTRTPIIGLQERGSVMLLFVQSRPPPLEATVWIGWLEDEAVGPVSISLLGLGRSEEMAGIQLIEAPDTERVLAGIRWRRFAGTLTSPLLGTAILSFAIANAPIFVTGPVVTQLAAEVSGSVASRALSSPPAILSPTVRDGVRAALARWQADHGRQLEPPTPLDPRHLPQLPRPSLSLD